MISGLYELFPENALLRESLKGLADATEPGGYLIYTGQPWHPQLEMIARTLSSHRDHKPWIMRRRTQAELDQLVEAAGFRKMDQLTDDWGIFTVSLAQTGRHLMTTAYITRSSEEIPPWRWALLWLAGLTPFFFLSYRFRKLDGQSSWRRALARIRLGASDSISRVDHPAILVTGLCCMPSRYSFAVTRRELNTHAKRLVAAQIISISAFLLFPLRFTFERPHVAGLFGWMFDALASFDMPFNQAPSLHLSLTAILWAKYSQHLRGWMLWVMRFWMIVVGVSTLTTYQHHFIDLPTGIWVGLFCIVLFPDNPPPIRQDVLHDPQRMKLGTAYLAGSVLLIAPAYRIGGSGLVVAMACRRLGDRGGDLFPGRPRAVSEIKRRHADIDDDPAGAVPGRSLAELSIVDMEGNAGR